MTVLDHCSILARRRRGSGIRKIILVCLLTFAILILNGFTVLADSASLQDQIDAAQPGDFLMIEGGTYQENIVIDKPIHLQGSGDTQIRQEELAPSITILSDQVVIENIQIEHMNPRNDHQVPAILVKGHNNQLENLRIRTSSYAIKLEKANGNNLEGLEITGDESREISSRQHGILIHRSLGNAVKESRISHVQDGIYVEKSKATRISGNTVSNSRYGYHLMFTKDTVIETNESFENISGMMVMGDEGTQVLSNRLRDNQKNIRSLGLLIFDTQGARVEGNEIYNNRIGIFVEDARDNLFVNNLLRSNYIGVQFLGARNNHLKNNYFMSNVVQGQAKDSAQNEVDGNYWDDHKGVDLTGNNRSDLKYYVDPFFLHLTNQFPPFQLLFQSPGMVFLENLVQTPPDERLVDSSPLMEAQVELSNSKDQPLSLLLVSLTLLVISLTIIILGVKVNEKKV